MLCKNIRKILNQLGIDFPITFFLQILDSLWGECLSAKLFLLSNTEFWEIFAHLHGSLFFIPMRATSLLASFSRRYFGTRSMKSKNSEVNLFRKWPIPTLQKKMQNDERMDTKKVEKMKAQTTRQTARKTAISNKFKNFITETPWNDIPIEQDRGTENKPSHSIPFQKYFVWQVQLNDPRVFVKLVPPLVQLLSSKAHSSISENNRKTLIRGLVEWITLKDYISLYTVFIFK